MPKPIYDPAKRRRPADSTPTADQRERNARLLAELAEREKQREEPVNIRDVPSAVISPE